MMNKSCKSRGVAVTKAAVLVALGLAVGLLLRRGGSNQTAHVHDETQPNESAAPTVWTCSMHPQIKLPKSGKCPICFMDLIPLDTSDDGGGEREIKISETAAKLLRLETAAVARRNVSAEVRLVGRVDYDETRLSHIAARVTGRLDRLFVNYTGMPVRKGDHMAEIYSPELLTAQEELLQALKAQQQADGGGSELLRRSASETLAAARAKLSLLGLSDEQIGEISESGRVRTHVTLFAPEAGVVLEKSATEGMYVETGTRIFTVADLSSVWVKLDAYESDLAWIRYGGSVEFTTEAHPGQVFEGTISFVAPVMDPDTRTARVRLQVANESLALKPGMFVRAVARARVARDGKVMSEDLSGQWICPMHPEVVKSQPANCDVCGMPLASAESLGYIAAERENQPLTVPVSAVLKTGKRAVAYVSVPDSEKPTYEGRTVDLGPRVGDYYVVKAGLVEGERMVSRGAFMLDSELQIQAKPSMMAEDEVDASDRSLGGIGSTQLTDNKRTDSLASKISIPAAASEQVAEIVQSYFGVQTALAEDDAQSAVKKADAMLKMLKTFDAQTLSNEARSFWTEQLTGLNAALLSLRKTENIDEQRKAFALLSDQLTRLVRVFTPTGITINKAFCPMAFNDRGASWLQVDKQIANPYFGAMMLRCGEIQEEIVGGAEESHNGR